MELVQAALLILLAAAAWTRIVTSNFLYIRCQRRGRIPFRKFLCRLLHLGVIFPFIVDIYAELYCPIIRVQANSEPPIRLLQVLAELAMRE